jgi:hypothetical protein
MGGTALASALPSHRCRSIVVVSLSLSPSHRCHPIVVIVVVVIVVIDIIVVIVIVAAAIAIHVTFIVVAIVAAIPVFGVAAIAVAVVAVIVNIIALSLSCSSYYLAVNGQSKEFDQSKPRRYHPWHVDGRTALGLAIGWPMVLLGQHLVHDVILSEIS